MPAPRLLDKKVISGSLAQERKQDIDKGVKLAKAVDALKEAKDREQMELEEMRVNTLKIIQAQIDAKSRENDEISQRNQELKANRILLEGPIDLIEAWQEVHSLKEKNEEISTDLLRREIRISSRESDVRDAQEDLTHRSAQIVRSEEAVDENLRQSEAQREESKDLRNEAQDFLMRNQQQIAHEKTELKKRESLVEDREEELTKREEAVQNAELTINREKILLADRRAMLEEGFAELRRKQT